MLLAENLTFRRSFRRVLDQVDFHVAPSELVALVGPAGAGKTSVLECFLGRHRPSAGRVCIDGSDLATLGDTAASLVAHVPAELAFPANARLLAHVRHTCTQLGRRIPEPILCDTLVRGGISGEWHEQKLGECSPAVQRALALTLAALKNAPALFIDEPARDLTETETDALILNLRKIRKRGAAILLATRDLDFARRLATRVVLLERGAVVETFDPNASLRAHRAESYFSALVG